MDLEVILTGIKKIQETFILLQNSQYDDLNEANTSRKLVEPFLELLGYKQEWQYSQNHAIKGKAIPDITIRRENTEILFVEVKKASTNKLNLKDLHQLTSYLNSKNIEWGILTDGKEYILVSNDLKGDYNNKEVLKFNLFNEFDINAFKYFTLEYLFNNRYTYYKKLLKQYQVFKLKENNNFNSWSRYNETIEKYFMYLEKKVGYSYKELKYLSSDDFVEFIKYDILESKLNVDRKEISSIATVKNKYAHMKNFYDLFVKNRILTENPFKYNISDKELIKTYSLNYGDESISLTNKNVQSILEGYDKIRNPERNKLLFLLCLYCGLSREQLENFKISDIDFENRSIKFKNKIFVFPSEFISRIRNYIDNIRDVSFNSDYFFVSKYAGNTEHPIGIATINSIIKKASESLIPYYDTGKIQVNPEKIKGMLAKKLFDGGFTLEEIIYITGLSLSSLSNIISTEMILERGEVRNLNERHPYINFFKE